MRSPFRVLHLPEVPLQKILQSLNYDTLVYLACCSTPSALAVRKVLRGVKALRPKMNVAIGDTWRVVEVVNPDGRSFRWFSYSPRHPDSADVEKFVASKIFGSTMTYSIGNNAVYHVKQNFEKDLIFWTTFLKLLFTCTMDSVTMYANWNTNFHLLLSAPVFLESEQLTIRQFVLKHREMEFLLENYKTKSLICQGRVGCEFKYLAPITFPNVVFERATFLTFNNLIQMMKDCENIEIGAVSFESEELNELLKEWAESKSKLKTLVVKRAVDSEPLKFEEVLEDIETNLEPVEGMNVSEQFIDDHLDKPSWNIKRADGVPATIYMLQVEPYSEFELHVWHPENA